MKALEKIIVIIGTTGAGKTKLSIEIAQAINGEIVNIDAIQMYRGLDIATAKPTFQEKDLIPHHLFDVLDPMTESNVFKYLALAIPKIQEIHAKGKVPIIVGGTMYYVEELLWQSNFLVYGDKCDLNLISASKSNEDLKHLDFSFEKLKQVDPVMANRLHTHDKRKIRRSLEIFYQTGIPQSELINQQKQSLSSLQKRYDACILWPHCDRQVLHKRLDERVDSMLNCGLIEEMEDFREKELMNKHEILDQGILKAIGYKEFHHYFLSNGRNEELLNQCIYNLKASTRGYARRQLLWIRNRLLEKDIPIYKLDSTFVEKWKENVSQSALKICHFFLNSLPIPSDIAHYLQTPKQNKNTDLFKWKKYVCDSCNFREFNGEHEWCIHLKTKSHKYHAKKNKKH